MQSVDSAQQRIAIRENLLTARLSPLEDVRLLASRCSSCGETALGRNSNCPNCGMATVQELSLSRLGRLWTYTIVRHRPPGDYKGPDPFVSFALGLVELPEGLRVLTPIDAEISTLKIGMELQFHAFVRPSSNNPEIVIFDFVPVTSEVALV